MLKCVQLQCLEMEPEMDGVNLFEILCNSLGGLGPNPTDLNKYYTLKECRLGLFDR